MVIKVCTVILESLIKNYAIRGIEASFSLNRNNEVSANWRQDYTSNLGELLCGNENVIIVTLRKLFAAGFSKDLLNKEDWEEIKKNNQEGNDYCIRVTHENETLCILSKKEIK